MKFEELKKAAKDLVSEGIWNVTGNVEVIDEAGTTPRKVYSLSFSYPKIPTDVVQSDTDEVDTGEDEFEDATGDSEELCTPDEMVSYLKKAMAHFGGAGPDAADIKVRTAPNGDTIVTCRKIEISDPDEKDVEEPKPRKCCCGGGCCGKHNKDESDILKSMIEEMVGSLTASEHNKREAWKAMRDIFNK